jgi:glyoxylate utilization-related uncharacterized protein
MDRRALRSRVGSGAALPGDLNIRTRLLTLSDPSMHSARTEERQEAIVYVTGGRAEVRVGRLGGRLGAHEFVHVPVGTQYSVAPAGESATLFLFEMPGG